jgi:hypothetical protein
MDIESYHVHKCFACNNKRASHAAVTSDGQHVFVGSECIKKIRAAGTVGYQPPLGGPVLFLVENAPALDRPY